MGIVFMDWETEKKLRTIKITVMMLGIRRENPWLYFKAIVKQISKKPASKRKTHETDIYRPPVALTRVLEAFYNLLKQILRCRPETQGCYNLPYKRVERLFSSIVKRINPYHDSRLGLHHLARHLLSCTIESIILLCRTESSIMAFGPA